MRFGIQRPSGSTPYERSGGHRRTRLPNVGVVCPTRMRYVWASQARRKASGAVRSRDTDGHVGGAQYLDWYVERECTVVTRR